jgi:hypothetical protein
MSIRRHARFLTILIASALLAGPWLRASAQPANPVQILVLNSQWNLAYARSACESSAIWYRSFKDTIKTLGCDNLTGCPEMSATVKACQSPGPAKAVSDFEQRLTAALATDAACASINVVHYNGAGDAAYDNFAKLHDPAGFWTLSVNFHPGATTQPWELKRGAASTKGNDDSQGIAGKVCSLILGQGPKAD